jgi:hypothetical protein
MDLRKKISYHIRIAYLFLAVSLNFLTFFVVLGLVNSGLSIASGKISPSASPTSTKLFIEEDILLKRYLQAVIVRLIPFGEQLLEMLHLALLCVFVAFLDCSQRLHHLRTESIRKINMICC